MRTLVHCWWECKLVQPPWKTVWKVLNPVSGTFFLFCFWLQSMWDLSSLTRDQTHILCTESLES